MPPAQALSQRRSRIGVSLMFFSNGVLFSALLPRYPEFKAAFGLSNTQFGLVVIAFPAGALMAAGFGGLVIRRLGTLRTNGLGSVMFAASMALAGASHAVWLFAGALVVAGAADSVVDAAQNVQGVLLERWRGRSTINSFHAVWSAGAATGGAIGAGAVALGIAPSTQMLITSTVWAAVALAGCRQAAIPADVVHTLDARDVHHPRSGPPPGRRRAWVLLVPLVALAICGTSVEDIANNWATLYLHQVAGAPLALAGLGVSAVLLAQFVGRLAGDPMTDRWGRAEVATAGGLLIAAGALMVVLAPGYPLAFLGFALTGIGSATLVPAAFAAAGRIPHLRQGTGIAMLGWLMRLGFLFTSPSVGRLADLTSLRIALLLPVGAGLVAALVARSLRSQPAVRT
ncbi:MAG: hypothetical protein JWR52_2393 [Marmoricola sp.]|nr:hypothetical protein [Marmoricola sp.]